MSECFRINPTIGGWVLVPFDEAHPLLDRIYQPEDGKVVKQNDVVGHSTPELVARIRSVAKNNGLVATRCGSGNAVVISLRERVKRERIPKPRRGWINTLHDLATLLYTDPATADLDNDIEVRKLVDHLSNQVFKATSCGAWLGLMRSRFDPAVGSVPARYSNGQLVGVALGSIVEGVDTETDVHELRFPFTRKQFWAALDAVEKEAKQIWDDTHGCVTCAKHWHAEEWTEEWGPFDGCDGVTPVWEDCPDCEGSGAVI